MRDILHGYSMDEDLILLNLRGTIKEVTSYLKALRKLKRSGDVRMVDVSFERYIGRRQRQFPKDFLQELERALPDPPYSNQQVDELAHTLE